LIYIMEMVWWIKPKTCFKCKIEYPNLMYPKNRMKYQRPDDLGTCKNCYICTYKTWAKNKSAWLYNPVTGKFNKIEFKSKWEIIKRLFNYER